MLFLYIKIVGVFTPQLKLQNLIRTITPVEDVRIMRDCVGETQTDRINKTRDVWNENGMQITIEQKDKKFQKKN